MDAGSFALRLVVATVLFIHATQKWRGWFNGPGLEESVKIFQRLGQQPPRLMVRVAATTELLSASLLLVGFATPLGALLASGTLIVAATAQLLASGSLANAKGGGEYPLVLALVAMAIGMMGPASWSVDSLLDAPWTDGLPPWAVVLSIALPIAGAVPAALRTRMNLIHAREHSLA
jgi:putative oxidoreductase